MCILLCNCYNTVLCRGVHPPSNIDAIPPNPTHNLKLSCALPVLVEMQFCVYVGPIPMTVTLEFQATY